MESAHSPNAAGAIDFGCGGAACANRHERGPLRTQDVPFLNALANCGAGASKWILDMRESDRCGASVGHMAPQVRRVHVC